MKVVLDANNIIHRKMNIDGVTSAYITTSVLNEIKDRSTQDYLSIFNFLITIRDPKDEFIKAVQDKTKDLLLYLSPADIDVVALTLEINQEINSN